MAKNSPILENVIYLGENKQYIIFYGEEGGHQKNIKCARSESKESKVKKRRFSAIKQASECCRLFREFMEGKEIGHDGLMKILYTLIRIREGKKIFFEGIYTRNQVIYER